MTIAGLDDARRILGDAVLGPDELAGPFGSDFLSELRAEERAAVEQIPFDQPTLEAARDADSMLVLRVARNVGGPLTILRLGTIIPDALDPRVHTGVGYALRDEWTIDTQPFARDETCAAGWALVRKAPLETTFNRTRAGQEAILAALPRGPRPVRRSAVEIVYDTLLWHRARGERLHARTWDWSRTESTDAGYAAVGDFGDGGLRVVAYSAAVRFGALGVCPQQ